jgi:hypothetical protein
MEWGRCERGGCCGEQLWTQQLTLGITESHLTTNPFLTESNLNFSPLYSSEP